MKRVTPQPILPRDMGENWRLEVLRLLREYWTRSTKRQITGSEFVAITGAYTAGGTITSFWWPGGALHDHYPGSVSHAKQASRRQAHQQHHARRHDPIHKREH
ncbi:MAG: hypothetical protein IPK42_25570 [Betaproteobacteria bacterium]|nr:hypothetical protein [Betaproteobacteria bacterium]